MTRIKGIDPDATKDNYIIRVFEAQKRHWGAPLANHLVYARRAKLFKAVRGMWAAMDEDQRLGEALVALVNRRVAQLNHCGF